MSNAKEDQKKPRGDLQLIALGIINSLKEDYTFDQLTKDVGEACFPGHPEMEPKARHLVRYLVKNQDRITLGKQVTLRQQGRIVAPSWYIPVAVDPNCSKDDPRYKEHMAAVAEMGSKSRPSDEVTYLDFPLKAPTSRKKPTVRVVSTETTPTKETRGTPDRLNLIKEVARNFKARTATERMKEMAQAGAAAFSSPTVIQHEEAPTPVASELEGEGI